MWNYILISCIHIFYALQFPGTNFCINFASKYNVQYDFIMGRIKFCNPSGICIGPHFCFVEVYFDTALHFSLLMSFSIPCVHFQLDCFIATIFFVV